MLIEFKTPARFGEPATVFINPAFVAAVVPDCTADVCDPATQGRLVETVLRKDKTAIIYLCAGDKFAVLDPEGTAAQCIHDAMGEEEVESPPPPAEMATA